MSSTFYLKYRPQTIGELDLVNVREQLTKLMRAKSIPHAFLFSGPRGLGKTSAARILAKALNCPHAKDFEPCNACDICKSITKGNAVDVIEIDGASNRGIDDIRTLREGVISAPIRLAKKVYVIDEVHMLTKEAFNALLKTLEEPPSHVMFIFATTEPNKLPETIVSRTFHITFQRATNEEIKRSLEKVIKGESLTVDDGILEKIMHRAEGGFRDSIKMLEQLAFADSHITTEVFAKIFPQADVVRLLELLAAKDAANAYTWLEGKYNNGVDWLEVIRESLILLQQELMQLFRGEKSAWVKDDVRHLIDLFVRASREQKFAVVETLPLSLVIADWCSSGVGLDSGSSSGEESVTKKGAKVALVLKNEAAKTERVETIDQPIDRIVVNQPEQPKKADIVQADAVIAGHFSISVNYPELNSKWEVLLENIKLNHYSVSALLNNSKLEGIEADTVLIKVFYQFHKEQLESDKNIFAVQSGFERLFACRPRIRYILGARDEKKQITEKKDEELVLAAAEIFT